jgi:hypothetical protein
MFLKFILVNLRIYIHGLECFHKNMKSEGSQMYANLLHRAIKHRYVLVLYLNIFRQFLSISTKEKCLLQVIVKF